MNERKKIKIIISRATHSCENKISGFKQGHTYTSPSKHHGKADASPSLECKRYWCCKMSDDDFYIQLYDINKFKR